jgi:VCBS repeat-containing protein
VTVHGTGVAGETITVYDGSTAVGTATVASNGTWTLSARLASGSHTLTATQTLTAGVTSNASAGFIVTVPSH